jgi:hypothetical protein
MELKVPTKITGSINIRNEGDKGATVNAIENAGFASQVEFRRQV